LDEGIDRYFRLIISRPGFWCNGLIAMEAGIGGGLAIAVVLLE